MKHYVALTKDTDLNLDMNRSLRNTVLKKWKSCTYIHIYVCIYAFYVWILIGRIHKKLLMNIIFTSRQQKQSTRNQG